VFLINLLDGTNVCGANGGVEGTELISWSKVVKGALPIHLFRHLCCKIYHLASMRSISDRHTAYYHAKSQSCCMRM